MVREIYTSGEYLKKHPERGAGTSSWKAERILQMLRRHRMEPRTACDVGCGAGEVLKQLHDRLDSSVRFVGYEISPQAHHLCKTRESERLRFVCGDFLNENTETFDLMLLIDVVEHVEDCFGFLRALRPRAQYKILHLPLDLSAQSILRNVPMRMRENVGHLHCFTKDTALATVREAGYEIVDWTYTDGSISLPAQSVKSYLARLPRRLLFALRPDFAVRLLGGYALLILAK